jgi:hypothetical protein
MPFRRLLLWVALAIAGLLVAVAVTTAATSLTSQRVGLQAEPLDAGDELAPKPARSTTPTPAPTRTPKPERSPTPQPTPDPTPTAEAGDDHGGGSRSGDDSSGRGRGGDDD